MSGIMAMVLGAKTAIAAAVDEFFNRVTLLLPGDGTNGAQNNTFLDSSSNNFTITRNGNTTQGTFSPFSQTGWSNYFNGTSDNLQLADNAAWDVTSSGFTVEAWVYITANGTSNPSSEFSQTIAAQFSSYTGNGSWTLGVQMPGSSSGVKVQFFVGTTGAVSATEVTKNTWHHIAGVYDGSSTLSVYMDGVRLATASYSSTLALSAPLLIGQLNTLTDGYQNRLNGYISNLRISNTARYSGASYTVPTAPFSSGTANTSLLTCQDNRFRDASSNAFAITVNGTPSVQAFSPFAPTAAYSAATNGGSGYFDGTGDYLTMSSNAALAPGTGDFTIEAWLYPTAALSTYNSVYETAATNGLLFGKITSGYGVRSAGTADLIASTAPAINQWVHVAVSRSGTDLRLFINGELKSTVTNSTNFATGSISLGASGSGTNPFPGYISGLRFVKGTALYTATFTVPTSPPTAVSNTNFLGNFTNAGITDATGKNVLETVGNAQISTTQSKFGGSSMYFDGTDDRLFQAASNQNIVLGTGDFTVEAWAYHTSRSINRGIFQITTSNTGLGGVATGLSLLIQTDGKLNVYANGATNGVSTTTTTVALNTWFHFALVRSGGVLKLYLDGSLVTDIFTSGSLTDTFNYTGSYITVGGSFATANLWSGYIDDFRISKFARYTTTFTPPTQAFPLQ